MTTEECKTLFCKLNEIFATNFAAEIIAAVIVALLISVVLRPVWRWLRSWLASIFETRKQLETEIKSLKRQLARQRKRLNSGLKAVAMTGSGANKREGSGLWLSKPSGQADHNAYRLRLQNSIPIWVFANLKGGVGKTTNATNIAAKYALEQASSTNGKPVLLIDLDFQGSASAMALRHADLEPPAEVDVLATRMIRGDTTAQEIIAAPFALKTGVDEIPLRVVPALYSLAQAENRLMIEWLFGKERADIRYTLANQLLDDQIQNSFSRIIIDAPPRLSTACVQALCAATHVIIPTLLDRLSGEAASTFLHQVNLLKQANICPEIQCAGIIGYRSGDPSAGTRQAQRQIDDAIEKIQDALAKNDFDRDQFIDAPILVHNPLLAESAGQYIALARTDPTYSRQLSSIKTTFDLLTKEIEKRL